MALMVRECKGKIYRCNGSTETVGQSQIHYSFLIYTNLAFLILLILLSYLSILVEDPTKLALAATKHRHGESQSRTRQRELLSLYGE